MTYTFHSLSLYLHFANIQIHTVVGAGAAGGAMDAGNLLKPMLGRGELRCIGEDIGGEGRGRGGKLHCISDGQLC